MGLTHNGPCWQHTGTLVSSPMGLACLQNYHTMMPLFYGRCDARGFGSHIQRA